MAKIEIHNLHELIQQNYPQEIVEKMIQEVLMLSMIVKNDYPDYKEWYTKVQVPGLYTNERNIIIAHINEKIVGFVSLKKTPTEKKYAHFMWKKVLEEIK